MGAHGRPGRDAAACALHILFISRAYFFDTLYARLQDQSAIFFYLTLPFLTPALQERLLEIPRSAPLRHPLRLPIEMGLVALLVIVFVLLRRDGRPQRWFEQLILRYRRGLLRAGAALIVLLGIYGYLIRPQILTPQMLAAAPGCLSPAQLRAPSGDCLALQGYIGAPVKPPAHPNQVAYLLGDAPDVIRGQALPPRSSDTDLLPGNPGKSEKIGIAQANLVRLGWYLSPLGVLLGVLGFALWWRRGLTRELVAVPGRQPDQRDLFLRLAYGTDATDLYLYSAPLYAGGLPGMEPGDGVCDCGAGGTKDERRRRTKDVDTTMDGDRACVCRLSSFVYRLSF